MHSHQSLILVQWSPSCVTTPQTKLGPIRGVVSHLGDVGMDFNTLGAKVRLPES